MNDKHIIYFISFLNIRINYYIWWKEIYWCTNFKNISYSVNFNLQWFLFDNNCSLNLLTVINNKIIKILLFVHIFYVLNI